MINEVCCLNRIKTVSLANFVDGYFACKCLLSFFVITKAIKLIGGIIRHEVYSPYCERTDVFIPGEILYKYLVSLFTYLGPALGGEG